MSEKRYYVSCLLYLCDKDLSNTLSIFECADLLNQLTEENEQLKSENKKLKCINDQLEERLESSGIGIALKMVCENDE